MGYGIKDGNNAKWFGAGKKRIHQVVSDIVAPLIMSAAIKYECTTPEEVIAVCHQEYYLSPIRPGDWDARPRNRKDWTNQDHKSWVAEGHFLHWTLDGVRMTPTSLKTLLERTTTLFGWDYLEDMLTINKERLERLQPAIESIEERYLAWEERMKSINGDDNLDWHDWSQEQYLLYAEFEMTKWDYDWFVKHLETRSINQLYWEQRKEHDEIMAA